MSYIRDKLEFPFRFFLNYAVTIGLVALTLFLLDTFALPGWGFAVQAFGFACAYLLTQVAYKDYLAHLIAQSSWVIWGRVIFSVVLISIGAALMAVLLGRFAHQGLHSFGFLNFEWMTDTRWLALFGTYFAIAFVFTQRFARRLIKDGLYILPNRMPAPVRDAAFDAEEDAIWDPAADHVMEPLIIPQDLADVLRQLPEDQLNLLLKAAEQPGLPLVTRTGSDNDTLWHLLSNYMLTEETAVPKKIRRQVPKNAPLTLSAWRVTENGGPALIGLRPRGRRLLRVVNA